MVRAALSVALERLSKQSFEHDLQGRHLFLHAALVDLDRLKEHVTDHDLAVACLLPPTFRVGFVAGLEPMLLGGPAVADPVITALMFDTGIAGSGVRG